jgi:N-acetyl-anhydromuramyl-L-alanine amidase AmpD
MRLSLPAVAAAVLVSVGCGGTGAPERTEPETEVRSASPLDAAFEEAGAEFGVPPSLLKAISYVETQWEMVSGETEFEGRDPAFGVMGLRGEALERGAALAGVSVEQARTELVANVRAGAALLSAYATEAGFDRGALDAWGPAVARYSGIEDPEAQAIYVHDDVYGRLRTGAAVERHGQAVATLEPLEVDARFPAKLREGLTQAAPDYSAAVWRPSPNYSERSTGTIGDVAMVIIHTCEGSYTSCWSWLTNPNAGVSAHYVVKEDGGEISQLVLEAKKAWHIGSSYDCDLNDGVDCWRNGSSNNHFTVGIEHGGFASQSTWPASQLNASAKLVCDISKAHKVPRDRFHILGHGQLQPANRVDPGPNWPWNDYYARINNACFTPIVVDSLNANNNTNRGYVEFSSSWSAGSSAAGLYGDDYRYAATQPVSDGFTFWFHLPAGATRTIDAWWTSGANRSTTAPFVVYDSNGTKLGTVSVNQQLDGGAWNALGSFRFTAGWNKVVLSRWTTEGSVVIADAIRVR